MKRILSEEERTTAFRPWESIILRRNMHKDGQKLWQDILTGVKLQVSLSTFKTWFSGSYVIDFKKTADKNILIVGFKNSFLKEQVEGRYSPVITEVKNKKGYLDLEVIFVVSQRESVN